ncbi:MAG TPA: hypothetical protein VEL71_06570 [Candidatus Dormibacteraeota bacterium]|nr:hypothetical protein [Candidatus Dormibacteraeota bacterium]
MSTQKPSGMTTLLGLADRAKSGPDARAGLATAVAQVTSRISDSTTTVIRREPGPII